jgi:uncharacterized protein with HEPN domain
MLNIYYILAHHYFGINVDIVWQIISIDLPKLKIDLENLVNPKSD